tara:strand:- start:10492 stop:10923 length:432 start_codon:yes stop_codon:yes gene_type:complete
MPNEIFITDEVKSTPYKDHEHPSLRFNIKENDEVTKHLLFFKTDKNKSFSEGRTPSDILFDMFKEIQTLPKIENKDNENDKNTFKIFLDFITPFIPHLVINSNADSNVVEVNDINKEVTIEKLHEVFKATSKGKAKSMIDVKC